jgi:hypothetical protein
MVYSFCCGGIKPPAAGKANPRLGGAPVLCTGGEIGQGYFVAVS